MVETAAALGGIPAFIRAAENHNDPLWPRYVPILEFTMYVFKAEEVFWVPERQNDNDE